MNIFEKYPNNRFLNNLPDDSDLFPLRQRVAEIFQSLDGLEDPDFAQKLEMEPHAMLWEMMMATILTSEGYQPARPRSDHGVPDFAVEKDGQRIFIEATCPGRGEKGNTVPPTVPIRGPGIAQDIPEAHIVLRMCSALKNKKDQYDEYLTEGVISQGDVCIIAICSSRIDRAAGLWPPAIMRATHGLADPYIVFGKEGPIGEGIGLRESIPNANGAEIDTRFFLSEENGLISAVLYSDCSFFSLAFDLFADSMLIHNPKAMAALGPGFLKLIKEIG